MRRLTVLLMLGCTTVALPACGGDEAPKADKEGKPKGQGKSQTLTQCLDGSGLKVERRDGKLSAKGANGATAEITTFASGAEASEFAGRQKGSATQAGKVVAVYGSGSNPTKTDVDACLSKAG